RRRHTRSDRDWSSDVCSSDLTVVRRVQNVGPQAIRHLGQLPATTISFNLKTGVSLGDAVDKVQSIARQTLPATVQTSFQGTAQRSEERRVGKECRCRSGT